MGGRRMTSTATNPRFSGHCVGCDRDEITVQTRYDHAAKLLCDVCAAQPHSLPTVHGLDVPAASNGAAEPRAASATPAPADAATLAQRLADARVDLLAHIDGNTPERAWLPRSERMLARGGRHHGRGPAKVREVTRLSRARRRHVIADARVVTSTARTAPRSTPAGCATSWPTDPPPRVTRSANASSTTPGRRSSSPTASSSPTRFTARTS